MAIDYARFVDGSPDYVRNFALRKTLPCNPDYRKWKASRDCEGAGKRQGPRPQAGKQP